MVALPELTDEVLGEMSRRRPGTVLLEAPARRRRATLVRQALAAALTLVTERTVTRFASINSIRDPTAA